MMPTQRNTKTKAKATKSNLLLALARKSASNFRRTAGVKNWFAKLCEKSPRTADELKALAIDWNAGGETRDLLPTMSDFHRFVESTGVKCQRPAFVAWLKTFED